MLDQASGHDPWRFFAGVLQWHACSIFFFLACVLSASWIHSGRRQLPLPPDKVLEGGTLKLARASCPSLLGGCVGLLHEDARFLKPFLARDSGETPGDELAVKREGFSKAMRLFTSRKCVPELWCMCDPRDVSGGADVCRFESQMEVRSEGPDGLHLLGHASHAILFMSSADRGAPMRLVWMARACCLANARFFSGFEGIRHCRLAFNLKIRKLFNLTKPAVTGLLLK